MGSMSEEHAARIQALEMQVVASLKMIKQLADSLNVANGTVVSIKNTLAVSNESFGHVVNAIEAHDADIKAIKKCMPGNGEMALLVIDAVLSIAVIIMLMVK